MDGLLSEKRMYELCRAALALLVKREGGVVRFEEEALAFDAGMLITIFSSGVVEFKFTSARAN